jgi:endonuclease YncB( thermonuclease family)
MERHLMWSHPDLAQERRRGLAGLCLALLIGTSDWAPPAAALPKQIKSYAVVQDDASLLVRGRRIHLFGLYFPPLNRVCDAQIRPARCGTRAAEALRRKITGFVDCRPQFAYDNGSIAAVCLSGGNLIDPGVDLGAYLIEQGLALAGPDAPFSYRAIERIAERRGLGVWGQFVDDIRR